MRPSLRGTIPMGGASGVPQKQYRPLTFLIGLAAPHPEPGVESLPECGGSVVSGEGTSQMLWHKKHGSTVRAMVARTSPD